MANSYVTYTASAAQTDFAITFAYLLTAHLGVAKNGVELGASDFSIVTSPSVLARLTSGAAAGDIIKVFRITPATTMLVDFQDASVLTEQDLDDSNRQLLYLTQEAYDNGTGISLDFDNKWNFEAIPATNLAAPTSDTDACTKAYTDGLTLYNSGAAVPQSWATTGDNFADTGDSTYSYTLASPTPQGDNEDLWVVSINGVVQAPTTDFTVTESADVWTLKLIFDADTAAPAATDKIVARNFGLSREYLVTPVRPESTSSVGLTVKGLGSQTGALQQWQDSAAAVKASVDKDGQIQSGVTTTKTDHLEVLETGHSSSSSPSAGAIRIKPAAAGTALLVVGSATHTGAHIKVTNDSGAELLSVQADGRIALTARTLAADSPGILVDLSTNSGDDARGVQIKGHVDQSKAYLRCISSTDADVMSVLSSGIIVSGGHQLSSDIGVRFYDDAPLSTVTRTARLYQDTGVLRLEGEVASSDTLIRQAGADGGLDTHITCDGSDGSTTIHNLGTGKLFTTANGFQGGSSGSALVLTCKTNNTGVRLGRTATTNTACIHEIQADSSGSRTVCIENANTSTSSDVMDVKHGANTPADSGYWIRFTDGAAGGTVHGGVKGTGSNGVDFDTAFTAGHYVTVPTYMAEKPGLIVSSTGELWLDSMKKYGVICDALPHCTLSATTGDPTAYGVVGTIADEDNSYRVNTGVPQDKEVIHTQSIGEGFIWVTDLYGTVGNGDLITTSNIPGYGSKQDDDIVRSITCAKCIEEVDWSTVTETITFDGASYRAALVGCVYKFN